MIDQLTAQELLQSIIKRDFQLTLTRPQLERAILAIKTAQAGDVLELGEKIELIIKRRYFSLRQVNRATGLSHHQLIDRLRAIDA